jgi:haloalkane dehalogenase
MTLSRRNRLDPAVAAGYLAPYDSWSHRRAVYDFVRDIPDPSLSRSFQAIVADDVGFMQPDVGRVQHTWHTLREMERQLPTLADRPICLIWGMRDWCFRPDCLGRFFAAWPDAEVHQLADVGHWVVEDAPEESLAIVT